MTNEIETVFLKLGGSLITDKNTPQTPRKNVINRLAHEIKEAWVDGSKIRLVLGHGSGSFGHVPAKAFGTRDGVSTSEEWLGFLDVWYQARRLNKIVVDALIGAELPAIVFPVSASMISDNGKPLFWNIRPIEMALEQGLIPIVFGDVVFDQSLGGTILSTEDIFRALADHIIPDRILLAGIDAGVWADYPECTELISRITKESFIEFKENIQNSEAADVTGGMASKVQEMLEISAKYSDLSIQIFSGGVGKNVFNVLSGKNSGTRIS